jgi:hypothetical protein
MQTALSSERALFSKYQDSYVTSSFTIVWSLGVALVHNFAQSAFHSSQLWGVNLFTRESVARKSFQGFTRLEDLSEIKKWSKLQQNSLTFGF